MRIFSVLASLAMAMFLSTGCASSNHSVKMVGKARFGADHHKVWSRPTEVGFDVAGKSVEGVATDTSIFPLFGPIMALFNDGHGALERAAIYKAVKANNCDGLYVTATKSSGSGFWPFYKSSTVHVYGKPLTIKTIGQVTKDRIDHVRAGGETKKAKSPLNFMSEK